MPDLKKPADVNSFKQVFQGMLPDGAEVIQGIVTAASPLRIQALNNEKLMMSASILIVPRHLTDYQTTVDISLGKGSINSQTKEEDGKHGHPGIADDKGEHIHFLSTYTITGASMTVYNALKVGEKVHLLSFNNGKKYYVLDRV